MIVSSFSFIYLDCLPLPPSGIMNFDDDAPPELVDVSGGIQNSGESVNVKVPITIVTGEIINGASKNTCMK